MRAKRLMILFGAIVAVSAALPGLLGMQAQRHYDRYIDELASAGYTVTERSYARGWFGSEASFTAALPVAPDADTPPPALNLRSRIVHGPFLGAPAAFGLARIDSELRLGDIPLLVGDGKAPVRTVVGFDGGIHGVLDMPARTAQLADGTIQLDSAALTGELRLAADQKTADGHLRLPSLRLTGNDGESAELAGFYMRVGMRRSPSGLALGEWYLTTDSVRGTQGGEAFAVEGVELSASSDEQSGLVSGAADYRLRRIAVAGEGYGPMELRVTASRFSADALARVQQAANDAAGASEELRAQAMGLALVANADALLAHDPAIALERMQIDTPDGRVEGKLEVRATGLRMAEMKGVEIALRHVEGDASLRLPEVVLVRLLRQQALQQLAAQAEDGEELDEKALDEAASEFARQQVAGLIAQEVLVRQGGQLAAAAMWRNGLLTVNGKTVPVNLAPSSKR